jgi:hypothetical protein
MVALIALGLERRTECPWNESRYTAEQLAKGVSLVLYTYSPHGEVVVPPAVTSEAAKDPDTWFVDRLGELEAGGIVAWIKSRPAPPEKEFPPDLGYYPESWWGPWQIEQDLSPPKPRRGK